MLLSSSGQIPGRDLLAHPLSTRFTTQHTAWFPAGWASLRSHRWDGRSRGPASSPARAVLGAELWSPVLIHEQSSRHVVGFLVFCFLFFFARAHSLQRFLGQGSNPCHTAVTRATAGTTPLPNLLRHQGGNSSVCVGFLFFGVFFFLLFRAAPEAYGGSQARGLLGAVAAGLHHSHSNAGSEPHLGPTPQLTATLDP